jgi:nitrous oxide reductase
MSDSKKSRREFLGVAGATLAGAVIASTSLKLTAAAATSPAAAQAESLEVWLLNTGQQNLSPELFMTVREKVG